ncbi:MAG: heavy-metal-associated domain-containing protein [Bacteroidetes bacterium]|nr:heavy-metal-associated domain-containing protein [Bacteroidota bacterium]
MKTIIILFSLLCSLNMMAQSTVKTATFSVKGNCGECKERIENAADIKGVKNCVWDEAKKTVTVTYNSDKVTQEQIEKAIAKSGHATQNQKVDPAAYKALPACCKYESADCKKK